MDSDGQRAYAMGFLDGMYVAPLFDAPDSSKALLSLESCVEGMKASQVAAIIAKYVRDHPEHWHHSLNVEAYQAMRQACPIKQKPGCPGSRAVRDSVLRDNPSPVPVSCPPAYTKSQLSSARKRMR